MSIFRGCRSCSLFVASLMLMADGDNGSKHYIASLGGSRTGQGSASGWNLQA